MPVQKVLDAFRRYGSVRGAARALGLPPGTLWHRLKEAGVLDKGRPEGTLGIPSPTAGSGAVSGASTDAQS